MTHSAPKNNNNPSHSTQSSLGGGVTPARLLEPQKRSACSKVTHTNLMEPTSVSGAVHRKMMVPLRVSIECVTESFIALHQIACGNTRPL